MSTPKPRGNRNKKGQYEQLGTQVTAELGAVALAKTTKMPMWLAKPVARIGSKRSTLGMLGRAVDRLQASADKEKKAPGSNKNRFAPKI